LSLNILLWFARLVLSGCLLFGLAGYIGAGLLISARICWTLAALGLLWFAQHLIGTALQQATASDNRSGAWLRRRLVLDEAGTVRLTFWLQLLLNTLALVTAVILLLLIWGVPTAQLERLRDVLLGGFEIGGLLLSPITVGAALAVFVLLLIGVRLLRSFLSQQLLVQTRLDTGVRDALSTVSGYIGVFIALLAALSVLGFDFGKMALVLGGLSVGIGFGLQHIVSNFISGLILLFQRPIKAGDWVVVGDCSPAAHGRRRVSTSSCR
jgi:small-conductance mechanosensitive channel